MVTKNKAIDYFRKGQRDLEEPTEETKIQQTLYVLVDGDMKDSLMDGISADENGMLILSEEYKRKDMQTVLEMEEIIAKLNRKIDALPEDDGEIIRRWLAGETQTDIAKDIGITQGAVSNRINRILGRIKRDWGL
jgi:RNA polymerase sigma factor (sigma-70 family)